MVNKIPQKEPQVKEETMEVGENEPQQQQEEELPENPQMEPNESNKYDPWFRHVELVYCIGSEGGKVATLLKILLVQLGIKTPLEYHVKKVSRPSHIEYHVTVKGSVRRPELGCEW